MRDGGVFTGANHSCRGQSAHHPVSFTLPFKTVLCVSFTPRLSLSEVRGWPDATAVLIPFSAANGKASRKLSEADARRPDGHIPNSSAGLWASDFKNVQLLIQISG